MSTITVSWPTARASSRAERRISRGRRELGVVHLHARLGAHGAQLLAGRGPLHVGRNQEG